VTVAGVVYFVAHDRTVRAFSGYTPQRVSDHTVERAIESLTDRSLITAFTWVRDGHSLLCDQRVPSEWSYALDTVTGQVAHAQSPPLAVLQHRNGGFAFGKGSGGFLDAADHLRDGPTFFEDAGQPLVSTMTFAPLMYPASGSRWTRHGGT
jgi:hypothetical protein